MRTTAHNNNQFTVCLAAMADGRKLKLYVVFMGIGLIPKLQKVSGVVVVLSRNGWMNEEWTKDWVRHYWGTLNFRSWLLIWDAY